MIIILLNCDFKCRLGVIDFSIKTRVQHGKLFSLPYYLVSSYNNNTLNAPAISNCMYGNEDYCCVLYKAYKVALNDHFQNINLVLVDASWL